MKRDMELIRQILLALEGDEKAHAKTGEHSGEERAYHVALMIEAGLVVGQVENDSKGNPRRYFLSRMTWAGHEFLDALRDDNLWQKAKQHVLKPGASWSFDVLKEWAKYELKQKLGLPE